MPAGILCTSLGVVKEICISNITESPYETPSLNDSLEGLKILIEYILSRRRRNSYVQRFSAIRYLSYYLYMRVLPKPELYWAISDKWFRLLEFTLIIATLKYFSDTTHIIQIQALYWISYFVLFMWVMEAVDWCRELLGTKMSQLSAALISVAVIVGIYAFISSAVQAVINNQFL